MSSNLFPFKVLVLTGLLVIGSGLFAKEIGGVTLPDTLSVGGKDLVLNGAGLRKKLFIKVYAGGLYLPAKTKKGEDVINTDQATVIRLHFIYNGVSADKLTGAWNDGFKAATKGNTGDIQKEIDAFNALFTDEAKKNDVYDISYVPGQGVALKINGTEKGKVEASEKFRKALWGIWLGKKPADSGLKKGMLGS
ncbi:chalcone isomerase family protein [Acanthopleuribacter pedis]|uniref:Chalcone isomerase family protein n=1 Tax=Acanthopleuribacter pedis TaxID=442870 RepID=A0A8J7QDY5_9BACT|nr:chalcone isomerase family protein [Acanthopleuribacter pedis]